MPKPSKTPPHEKCWSCKRPLSLHKASQKRNHEWDRIKCASGPLIIETRRPF